MVLGLRGHQFPLVGRHMISNALLAAGAGYILGLSLDEISAGLTNAKLTSGRPSPLFKSWFDRY
jgi:UDP-N-acetylmuramyl pentapeptide synthase